MRAKRVDVNQDAIVIALRGVGATVQSLAGVGCGCPDLLVGINGRNYLMEVKDGAKPPSDRRMTPQEVIWHNEWKGKSFVVHDVKEALAAIGAQLM